MIARPSPVILHYGIAAVTVTACKPSRHWQCTNCRRGLPVSDCVALSPRGLLQVGPASGGEPITVEGLEATSLMIRKCTANVRKLLFMTARLAARLHAM